MNDNVNHPSHYQGKNGLEVIDVIDNFVGELQGEKAVCMGNVIKYILRHTKKNGVEDLLKARWYLDRLISYYDGPSSDESCDIPSGDEKEVPILELLIPDKTCADDIYTRLFNFTSTEALWDYIVELAKNYNKKLLYVYVEIVRINVRKPVADGLGNYVLYITGTLEDGVHAR